MAKPIPPVDHTELSTLGDHPALNFLNTVVRIDGELVDSLKSDGDVLRWLAQAGWPVEEVGNLQPSSLLDIARSFREVIRAAMERRIEGKQNIGLLNTILAEALSHLKLVPDPNKDGGLRLERQWRPETPEQMVAPVVEAAAVLLATGDLGRVKKCENEECVLWFYDRTRSHHRRWCNMATCGTRHKVAAFRKRRQGSSS
jgi:predicted RNA-binding Zn ribbon-like protein